MQLNPNTILQNGKYQIIKVLGQGGFGITYLANDTVLDRKVAIKEFFPKDYCGRLGNKLTVSSANQTFIYELKNKFINEARHIAKLNHPGIVKIHVAFEENDTAYYVMEYVHGETLSQLVKRKGKLDAEVAIGYIEKVGNALSYMHKNNYTHLDIKPANIIVRRSSDTPILVDFGLSTHFINNNEATATMPIGISHGFSPIELYHPESKSFSPQSDVYSLGATLYYLLSGQVPPCASEIGNQPLFITENIEAYLQSFLKKAMAFRKLERFIDMVSFLKEISILKEMSAKIDHNIAKPSDNRSFIAPIYQRKVNRWWENSLFIKLNKKETKCWINISDMFQDFETPFWTTWFIFMVLALLSFALLIMDIWMPISIDLYFIFLRLCLACCLCGFIIYSIGLKELCALRKIGYKICISGLSLLIIVGAILTVTATLTASGEIIYSDESILIKILQGIMAILSIIGYAIIFIGCPLKVLYDLMTKWKLFKLYFI